MTKPNLQPDFLLTITPAGRSQFIMRLVDEDLGTTDTPLYTAARILIDRGHDPEAVLAMKHAGSDIVAMRGRIGRLAGWSISDGPNGRPHLVRYRPMSGRLRPTTA